MMAIIMKLVICSSVSLYTFILFIRVVFGLQLSGLRCSMIRGLHFQSRLKSLVVNSRLFVTVISAQSWFSTP